MSQIMKTDSTCDKNDRYLHQIESIFAAAVVFNAKKKKEQKIRE